VAQSRQAPPEEEVAPAVGFGREVRVKADDRSHFVFDALVNERPVRLRPIPAPRLSRFEMSGRELILVQ
jgi:hypothetical protein